MWILTRDEWIFAAVVQHPEAERSAERRHLHRPAGFRVHRSGWTGQNQQQLVSSLLWLSSWLTCYLYVLKKKTHGYSHIHFNLQSSRFTVSHWIKSSFYKHLFTPLVYLSLSYAPGAWNRVYENNVWHDKRVNLPRMISWLSSSPRI